jgi:CheY-like chemotaxis protein
MVKVLVIEDEYPIRLIIRKVLEEVEHKVIEAEDGLEGLHRVREQSEPFSLIILDIHMPKMDGFEFLYRLRRQERLLTPVLVVTAHSNTLEKAQQYGADGHVMKPFERRQLTDAVSRLADAPTRTPGHSIWKIFEKREKPDD